jgi:hypothetical protein
MNGIYDRAWVKMSAPPFGIASADERLARIRAYA